MPKKMIRKPSVRRKKPFAWRDFSIRTKLSLINLSGGLLLSLIIFGALSFNERLRVFSELDHDLLVLAQMLGTHSSAALMFSDADSLGMILESLRSRPSVVSADMFTMDGWRLAGYERNPGENNEPPGHIDVFKLEVKNGKGQNRPGLSEGIIRHNKNTVQVFRHAMYKKQIAGTIHLKYDLSLLRQHLHSFMKTLGLILFAGLLASLLMVHFLEGLITVPLLHLLQTIKRISKHKNYSARADRHGNDEIGSLIDSFNLMLNTIQTRDKAINVLNRKLHEENQRMGAELNVSRKIQQMMLPAGEELEAIKDLDISAYMETADEVGGDYYDVLHCDGHTKIGIGDVTGHGLESGMVMLMVQMAVRTLFNHKITKPDSFLQAINQALYDNVGRMKSDKNLSLALLDYYQGKLSIYGQHEDVLLVRAEGKVEHVDTGGLGFMVGMVPNIKDFVNACELSLAPGDGIVLYTDGITEAYNKHKELYGVKRLRDMVSRYWEEGDARRVKDAVIDDLAAFIGSRRIEDDITLLVLKRVV